MAEKFDKELERVIYTIKEHCDREDRSKYNEAVALIRRNELWFHGNQSIYWNFSHGDWATPSGLSPFFNGGQDERGTADYYDYIINILKAHGESFISTLSAQIPTSIFPPADVDNENDISTSKAYNKISELIDNYNPIKYLFIKLLFTKFIQGTIAVYNYPDTDSKYGTYQIPSYQKDDQGNNEFKGHIEQARTRILIDILGPMNCKFPYYSKSQEDMGYIQSFSDQHYALMQSIYDDDEIIAKGASSGKLDRSPTSYLIGLESDTPRNLVTVTKTWTKPWMYRIIKAESPQLFKDLEKDYPSGLLSIHVEKKLCEVQDQNLDDRWTLSRSGTTSHSLSDPECQPLIHIQDIKNMIINLSVDIVEHSIPETFATTDVLNFDEYGKMESNPGYITQAKNAPGLRNLGEGFFTLPKTQLNPSIGAFDQKLDQEAQFVFGNPPSVSGVGTMGNRVPGEVYDQSRTQALQRWNLTWIEVVDVWKRSKMKAVKLFVEHMSDKEKFSKTQSSGRSITVYIERHELKGKVGDVEPQVSEAFPMTSEQKKSWLMSLIQLKSPIIESFLTDPVNREAVSDLLSFPELKVPGANQALKQLIEFQQLINSDAISNTQSAIEIDFDVDDHNIHSSVLRNLLTDEVGIDLKEKKPSSYLNCILHLKNHLQAIQAQTSRPYAGSAAGMPADSNATSSH